MERPNIILIITDQQRADMMSCTGNKHINTPNMDYLAKNGLRFNNAYCTNPVCSPSRFSIMTGKMPSEINACSDYDKSLRLTSDIYDYSIAGLLKKVGYKTVYAGKQGIKGLKITDLGFDVISRDERYEMADTCGEYIKNSDESTPFYMVASFINPHDICYKAIYDFLDYMGEEKEAFKIKGKEYDNIQNILCHIDEVGEDTFFTDICPPLPDNYEPQKDEPTIIEELLKQRYFRYMARTTYTDEQWRIHRYLYAKLTENVDGQIGVIINALKKKGIFDNTIIIFTGDHGDMDASHRMEHKSVLYEEAMRVPLIITDTAAKRYGVCNDPVSNGLDIYPTICEYAGIPKPKHLKGTGLKSVLYDQNYQKRKYLYVESEIGNAVVTGRYKYVLYNKGENKEQLYDLDKRPLEMFNDAHDEKYKDVLEQLREIMRNKS